MEHRFQGPSQKLGIWWGKMTFFLDLPLLDDRDLGRPNDGRHG